MEPDRRSSAVAEMFTLAAFGCGLLQGMVAVADHQDEPPVVSQVVCIRDASLLPTAAFPFAGLSGTLCQAGSAEVCVLDQESFGIRPSKRIAKWFNASFHLGIGIVHFLEAS